LDVKRYKDIHLSSRNSKNTKFKERYELYCKLLSKVIKEAKILRYKREILTSYNKTRTTCNIVKSETGGKQRERRNIITEYQWQANTKSTNNCKFF
jgi:hypothetical protein